MVQDRQLNGDTPLVLNQERKKITVFVRKDETGRQLSFTRPPEVTTGDALKNGFALDGRSLITSVFAVIDEGDRPNGYSGMPERYREVTPLAEALHARQVFIVEWLEQLGYDVEFD